MTVTRTTATATEVRDRREHDQSEPEAVGHEPAVAVERDEGRERRAGRRRVACVHRARHSLEEDQTAPTDEAEDCDREPRPRSVLHQEAHAQRRPDGHDRAEGDPEGDLVDERIDLTRAGEPERESAVDERVQEHPGPDDDEHDQVTGTGIPTVPADRIVEPHAPMLASAVPKGPGIMRLRLAVVSVLMLAACSREAGTPRQPGPPRPRWLPQHEAAAAQDGFNFGARELGILVLPQAGAAGADAPVTQLEWACHRIVNLEGGGSLYVKGMKWPADGEGFVLLAARLRESLENCGRKSPASRCIVLRVDRATGGS